MGDLEQTTEAPTLAPVVDAGPAGDEPGRPAILPLHPRFEGHTDVCVIIADGAVEIVARDVLEALGYDLGEWAADPSHEKPTSFIQHAAARTWSRATIAEIFSSVVDDERPAMFFRWLDARLGELNQYGLRALEERTLYGTRDPRAAAAPDVDDAQRKVPEFFSVAAAARILDRDPAISIGRQALFEHLHKVAWISREGRAWVPAEGIPALGLLARQDVNVPQFSRDEPYPQVVITAAGLRALHQRLGGVADLDFTKPTHLALV